MMKLRIYITALCIAFLIACSSDNATDVVDDSQIEVGDLKINFTNTVGDEPLNLNTQTYVKNGGETYKVNELKYIISNIVLTDTEGNQFVYPQADSYFLINEEVAQSKTITLDSIDANNYTSITFGFGVDQTNYPLNGVDNFVPEAEESEMLWSWSAGYKFLKFEGTYSTDEITDQPFLYHIGSHGQNLDNYREISLNFMQPLALSASNTPELNIGFDVQKIFNSDFQLLLSDKDDIQIDPVNAPKIVDNITNAFEIILN
ncbi:MbnP family protein [Mesohalobacter halotolerans]|uniref:Copper-binding protein MbnP-like domain-containing protein n=1 Tax=Mesohalobacter halotolerans TaxID=1883405 RepID=A0A4U5TPX0_9FLAO|nr:MbnP family protein [Mesohalobacter halotolerans]MBS3737946.1 hypothetical protein [Psychroflexus sp.]TKS56197.1 hypothetical protein FCN74_09300 [Mesohalobacter halotolerans]